VPGELSGLFVVVSAIGVVAGYSMLGATYLVTKTVGAIEQWARWLSVAERHADGRGRRAADGRDVAL
jgi:cytochrome bd-type quinol oxidase subunit 2